MQKNTVTASVISPILMPVGSVATSEAVLSPKIQTKSEHAENDPDHQDGEPGDLGREKRAQQPQQRRQSDLAKPGEDRHAEDERQPALLNGADGGAR